MAEEIPKPTKLPSWLTVDTVIHFGSLFVAIVLAYAYLASSTRQTSADIASLKVDVAALSKTLSDAVSDSRILRNNVAQQQAQSDTTVQRMEIDRKILGEINAKVEVLLDRTDPKKQK